VHNIGEYACEMLMPAVVPGVGTINPCAAPKVDEMVAERVDVVAFDTLLHPSQARLGDPQVEAQSSAINIGRHL
jgi:hypothetical protein